MNKLFKEKKIGVLPARWNSSRFPGKPLSKILGKSLIQRSYENAIQCQSLDKIIVATDDMRIVDHVTDFGGECVITSHNCQNGTERTAEVVQEYCEQPDIVVNIQGDEPCLDPHVVDRLVTTLEQNPHMNLVTPVALSTIEEEILTNKKVKCVFDQKGRVLYFSRSPIPNNFKSQAPTYIHIGIYAFRTPMLFKFMNTESTPLSLIEDIEPIRLLEIGEDIFTCIVETKSPSVDYPEDIKTVEEYLLCHSNVYS